MWLMRGGFIARMDFWLPRKDIDIDTYEFELVSMGRIIADQGSRHLVEYGDTRLLYSPVGGNLSLSTACSVVESDADYRTYAGQGRYKVRSASAPMRLLAGQCYYAGFVIDFDSADSAVLPESDVWTHCTNVGGRSVEICLHRSSQGIYSIGVE
jgi:hypothetical protein